MFHGCVYDAFDIFWSEILKIFELFFCIFILCQESLIFGLSWAHILSLDLQARVEFESEC